MTTTVRPSVHRDLLRAELTGELRGYRPIQPNRLTRDVFASAKCTCGHAGLEPHELVRGVSRRGFAVCTTCGRESEY